MGQKINKFKICNFGTTEVINIKLVSLKSDKKDLCKYIKSDSQLLIFKITLDYLVLYTFATCMLHTSTIALPSFFDRMTAQNSKNKLKNLRWTFFWLHCSDWNSLPADLRASPSLQTFKAKLKIHLFLQAFWLICTCQLLPVSYPLVYVCVCELGEGGGIGREGIKGK